MIRQRTCVAMMVALLGAATTLAWKPADPSRLPKKLLLAVDGVAYPDVQKLQKEGVFKDFYPVSRNVSTYPSMSHVAWADIFHTAPPRGVMRIYYSIKGNKVLGGALSDVSFISEYVKRMDIYVSTFKQHVMTYVDPQKTADEEIDTIVEDFFQTQGQDTYFAYMSSTDTLQHVNGDILPLLRKIDGALTKMSARYLEQTGRKLEIALISDHGNNHLPEGKEILPLPFLRSHGFNPVKELHQPGDVAVPMSGITTYLTLYTAPADVIRVATKVAGLEGAEMITHVVPGKTDEVRVLDPSGHEARVRFRLSEGRRYYSYEPMSGDPLAYQGVLDTLRAAGKLDDSNFALDSDWLEATSAHFYPVAPQRIFRGHMENILNAPPIIVSVRDGYQTMNPTVKALNRVKKRGGTHGALSALSTDGILLSNARATRDLTTDLSLQFLGMPYGNEYRSASRGGELVDEDGDDVLLRLWNPIAPSRTDGSVRPMWRVSVYKGRRMARDSRVAETLLDAPGEQEVAMGEIVQGSLSQGDYHIDIHYVERDTRTGKIISESEVTSLKAFTDPEGGLVAL